MSEARRRQTDQVVQWRRARHAAVRLDDDDDDDDDRGPHLLPPHPPARDGRVKLVNDHVKCDGAQSDDVNQK